MRRPFGRLSSLDPALRAYPAHDDEGRGHSTIGVELAHNPRLKVQCRETFIELMRGLRLTKPTHITDALSDPRQQLVSCCEFDCISTLAAVKLRRPGFQHAAALDGGMQAWRDTGNPPRTRAEPGTGPALFQRDAG